MWCIVEGSVGDKALQWASTCRDVVNFKHKCDSPVSQSAEIKPCLANQHTRYLYHAIFVLHGSIKGREEQAGKSCKLRKMHNEDFLARRVS